MAFQGDSIYWVEVEKVVPNPFQPRREFDQSKLQELADSIRMYGVLQPLTVTRNEVQRDDGTFYTEYELIAGERRLRASKLAGTAQVPVIIREGEQSEQEKLELAIIENLQREDLNAVDRALAFKQLAEMFGLSHAQVAEKVGRSREYVSNSIRLLGLPEKILEALKHGKMSEGHARTLLMLNDRPEEQDVIFREILLKKMSVREVERIVRKIATDKVRKKSAGDLDSNLIEFEKQFTETLGTRVQIQKTDFGGKLTIDYFSVEDLEGMLERMKKEAAELTPEQEAVDKLAEHTPLEQVREAQEQPSEGWEQVSVPEIAVEQPPAEAVHSVAAESVVSVPQIPRPAPVPQPQKQEVSQAMSDHSPQSQNAELPVERKPSALSPRSEERDEDSLVVPVPVPPVPVEKPATEPVYGNTPDAPVHTHHQPFAARYAAPAFVQPQPAVVEPILQPPVQKAPIESYRPNTGAVVPEVKSSIPEPESKPAPDESSLYSIRNFNV